MPIYEFLCPNCKKGREAILPIKDIDTPQICVCGGVMARRVSLPLPAKIVVTNRDRLVMSLNDQEGGYVLPGAKHAARYKSVIGDSLTRDKPVVGKGFGGKK